MRPEFLTRLAEADKHAAPAAAVEARLRAAVRARKSHSRGLAYALLAAAAAVLVVVWAIRKPAAVSPAAPVPALVAANPEPTVTSPVATVPDTAPPVRRVVRRPARRQSTPPVPVEHVTEFFALTADAQEIRPGSEIMRVRVPRSAMATFGFPLNAEMSRGQIHADVLVGDDGIARAIRFVHGN